MYCSDGPGGDSGVPGGGSGGPGGGSGVGGGAYKVWGEGVGQYSFVGAYSPCKGGSFKRSPRTPRTAPD